MSSVCYKKSGFRYTERNAENAGRTTEGIQKMLSMELDKVTLQKMRSGVLKFPRQTLYVLPAYSYICRKSRN